MLRKVTLFKASFADYLKMTKFEARVTKWGSWDETRMKQDILRNWDETRMKHNVLSIKDKKLSLREASNRPGMVYRRVPSR